MQIDNKDIVSSNLFLLRPAIFSSKISQNNILMLVGSIFLPYLVKNSNVCKFALMGHCSLSDYVFEIIVKDLPSQS